MATNCSEADAIGLVGQVAHDAVYEPLSDLAADGDEADAVGMETQAEEDWKHELRREGCPSS